MTQISSMAPEHEQKIEHNLDLLLKVAHLAADRAQVVLLDGFRKLKTIEEKFQAGLVTEYDKESERIIRETIGEYFPDHEILGEEFGGHAQTVKGYQWIIDPLDGTANYVYQFPIFNVSIGIYHGSEALVGVVAAPALDKRYHAVTKQGSFCNGTKIKVSSRENLKDTMLATGFASQTKRGIDEQVEQLRTILKINRGVRRAGAAALDLCWVAEGVFDGYWETGLSPWDSAAGALLVREAGGTIQSLDGSAFLHSIQMSFARILSFIMSSVKRSKFHRY